MKKGFRLLLTALLLISLSVLNSCNKDSLPSLNCKVDGDTWVSLFRSTTMGATDVGDGFMFIATDGTSQDEGAYLAMLVRGNTVKEYDLKVALTGGQLECAAFWMPNGIAATDSKKYVGRSGKISITAIDTDKKTISGTYSFELSTDVAGTDKVVITEGKFANLKYLNANISVADFVSVK